jgi:putative cell wall-binding protein
VAQELLFHLAEAIIPIYSSKNTITMKVKHILRIAAFAFVMAIALPARSNNIGTDSTQSGPVAKVDEARAQELMHRLEEIKAMDKSAMTRSEKKDLRKEVKAMRKEAREARGIYISIGALIIIILLLILIL